MQLWRVLLLLLLLLLRMLLLLLCLALLGEALRERAPFGFGCWAARLHLLGHLLWLSARRPAERRR